MPEGEGEPRLLTFDEFRDVLAGVFDTPADSLRADTSFLDDLAFDSLRMVLLATVFEDLTGEMPTEMAWSIQTVGEAYAYYAEQARARLGEGGQMSRQPGHP
jgi:acyl carrier protein